MGGCSWASPSGVQGSETLVRCLCKDTFAPPPTQGVLRTRVPLLLGSVCPSVFYLERVERVDPSSRFFIKYNLTASFHYSMCVPP